MEQQYDFLGRDDKDHQKVPIQIKLPYELKRDISLWSKETGVSISFAVRSYLQKLVANRRTYPGLLREDPLKEVNSAADEVIDLLPLLIRQLQSRKLEKTT